MIHSAPLSCIVYLAEIDLGAYFEIGVDDAYFDVHVYDQPHVHATGTEQILYL